jgi:peptide/nickel transport system permease protein
MSENVLRDVVTDEPGGPVREPMPTAATEAVKVVGRSPWQLAWRRLRRDKVAMVSLVIIILVVLIAVFAPFFADITHHGRDEQFRQTGLGEAGQPVAPGGTFWFGTDDQGRDILVRTAYGARISLLVGVVSTLLAVAVGVFVGLAAGYLGRVVDTILSRIVDVVLSLPFLLTAVAIVAVKGSPSLTITILVIAFFSWASVARIVRGQVLSLREREFVEAARSLGAGSFRIMAVDVLPNVLAQVIVYTTLLIPSAIVFEASLSFLGLGIPPPTPSWGNMLNDAQAYYHTAWWFLVFPGIGLLTLTLAFNLLGDGVRDAFDPRGDRTFALDS